MFEWVGSVWGTLRVSTLGSTSQKAMVYCILSFPLQKRLMGFRSTFLTYSFRDYDTWTLILCDLCNQPLDTHVSARPCRSQERILGKGSWEGTLSSPLTTSPASEHGSQRGGLDHRTYQAPRPDSGEGRVVMESLGSSYLNLF